MQAFKRLGVSVDPTGDVVAFQAEPIAALLAIGLPGGPAQLPQENHGALITGHQITLLLSPRLSSQCGELQAGKGQNLMEAAAPK